MNELISYLWPILGAVAAGAAIGFEREFRGRPAGFRTHILVCLASALLMLAAARQAEWSFIEMAGANVVADPTRMAHGILTGVGFLCGGVIFREGFSIHGLTTAASLWTTSSLGMLFGVELYTLAIAGTVATLAVLAALRLVEARIARQTAVDMVFRYGHAEALHEDDVRALLAEYGFNLKRLGWRRSRELSEHVIKAVGFSPLKSEALAVRLRGIPAVAEFEITPRDD